MVAEGHFWLWGKIEEDVALSLVLWLRRGHTTGAGNPIIHLCTSGDPGCAMLNVIDAIEGSAHPVTVIASGKCLSAGIPILAAGHIRKASRFTQFMLHGADGGVEEVVAQNNLQSSYLAERTAKSTDFWFKGILAGLWFYPQDALEWGLIDEVLNEPASDVSIPPTENFYRQGTNYEAERPW